MIESRPKFFCWRHKQKLRRHNLYYQNVFISRRPVVANFADIIKIATNLLKELEIMCSNPIYICISWHSKIC